MKRLHLTLLTLCALAVAPVFAHAQDASLPASTTSVSAQEPVPVNAEVVSLTALCESPTPYVNEACRLLIPVPAGTALPPDLPPESAELTFVQWQLQDVSSLPLAQTSAPASELILIFIPRTRGLLTLPPIVIDLRGQRALTTAKQILVAVPQRSELMSLTLHPSATHVRVGEPVRLDFTWECAIPAGQLLQLEWAPRFFFNPDIEIEIPRSTVPAERQIGLPLGGRRIIAEWAKPPAYPAQLGRVSFTLFVRFKKGGTFELPTGRLNVIERVGTENKFSPYAAYFNNGFFDSVDPTTAHRRWFVEGAPLVVQVTDLPPASGESFSGWFRPCRVEAEITPASGQVGQLMEMHLRVFSDTPADFLDAPDMAKDPALRHRFWVDKEVRRIWHSDGSEFLVRFRPLTTSIRAFPQLRFTVFDAVSGTYQTVVTAPQPLVVLPNQGLTVFNRTDLADNSTALADHLGGIWHNEPTSRLSDFMTFLINLLVDGFCYWLALLGLLAVGLRPIMEKRRRFALDPAYRRRVLAYRALRRCSEQSAEQMAAFREWMAALSGTQANALTSRDIEKILGDLRVSPADVAKARALFEAQELATYGREKSPLLRPSLGALAGRIARAAPCVTLLLLAWMLMPQPARAEDWAAAEAAFKAGGAAAAGSPESTARFAQAALQFEAVARQHLRPDRAWYNAGNSWMEAGQLGCAIAAYRQAQAYSPFDQRVQQSLHNARALRLDNLGVLPGPRWQWPSRWLQAVLVVVVGLLVGAWLAQVRYRNRATRVALGVAALGVLAVSVLWFRAEHLSGREGVVIVPEVQARKGPGYRYEPAFKAPLHDGTELIHREDRGDWQRVALTDGRECWLPRAQLSWQR